MVEAAEHIAQGRAVVLVINYITAGARIDNVAPSDSEVSDLNRGRVYLANTARRHKVPVYLTVTFNVHPR